LFKTGRPGEEGGPEWLGSSKGLKVRRQMATLPKCGSSSTSKKKKKKKKKMEKLVLSIEKSPARNLVVTAQ